MRERAGKLLLVLVLGQRPLYEVESERRAIVGPSSNSRSEQLEAVVVARYGRRGGVAAGEERREVADGPDWIGKQVRNRGGEQRQRNVFTWRWKIVRNLSLLRACCSADLQKARSMVYTAKLVSFADPVPQSFHVRHCSKLEHWEAGSWTSSEHALNITKNLIRSSVTPRSFASRR